MIVSAEALLLAQAHAVKEYPKESCGLIVDGAYLPCFNYASEPEREFKIADEVQVQLRNEGKKIQAIIHSHPNGPQFPSQSDMAGQLASGVPWGIIPTDGVGCMVMTYWGDPDHVPPFLGRSFMHGVTDCYSLIRDVYQAGKDACALQGIDWPFPPTVLPECAREDGWWGDPGKPGDDLYVKNFIRAGFREIAQDLAAPGDIFFCKVKSDQYNHGGLLIGGNLILHHLPGRLSRREPSGLWARAAGMWIRHEVADA